MKTEKFELTESFPISAKRLYDAWLSSEEHGKFTGGEAHFENAVGGKYTAWDQYISGELLELEPGKRILQTWRTSEFEDEDEDSLLEIILEDTAKGCSLKLKHWNIPEGQGNGYKKGWEDHYFQPMRYYFSH